MQEPLLQNQEQNNQHAQNTHSSVTLSSLSPYKKLKTQIPFEQYLDRMNLHNPFWISENSNQHSAQSSCEENSNPNSAQSSCKEKKEENVCDKYSKNNEENQSTDFILKTAEKSQFSLTTEQKITPSEVVDGCQSPNTLCNNSDFNLRIGCDVDDTTMSNCKWYAKFVQQEKTIQKVTVELQYMRDRFCKLKYHKDKLKKKLEELQKCAT